MRAFDELRAIAPLSMWEGIRARAVHGERLTLAVFELDPNTVVPEHTHDNEQLGMVLRGSLTFRVGDDRRELGPGGTWTIESNMPHDVRVGPEGAVVVDVFAPVRSDWNGIERLPPQEPRWP
jgi:quercetin dioxygenase-like cupin family protein